MIEGSLIALARRVSDLERRTDRIEGYRKKILQAFDDEEIAGTFARGLGTTLAELRRRNRRASVVAKRFALVAELDGLEWTSARIAAVIHREASDVRYMLHKLHQETALAG